MKAFQKLNIILFIVLAIVVYIVNKNNDGFMQSPGRTKMSGSKISIAVSEPQVDSTVFKKLLPFFRIEKDEFDPNGTLSYLPKDSPVRPKGNAMYCYFEQMSDSVANLRIRIQIENKEWLFFKKCQFLIDGALYEYYPKGVEFNAGGPGSVCEWFDNSINENNVEFIKALSNAKRAKMRVVGRHYDKVFVISNEQLRSIYNTLALYTAMGGEINS